MLHGTGVKEMPFNSTIEALTSCELLAAFSGVRRVQPSCIGCFLESSASFLLFLTGSGAFLQEAVAKNTPQGILRFGVPEWPVLMNIIISLHT